MHNCQWQDYHIGTAVKVTLDDADLHINVTVAFPCQFMKL